MQFFTNLPYFPAHKTHRDIFVRNFRKKINDECILISVIYWKKTGLLHTNWVVTRWQQYSTHLHTNSTQNDTIDKNNTYNNTIK